MSIEVWPFLVSRNPYLDYRTVVAPDFICELKIPNLLARLAEGELSRVGYAIIRHVIGSKAGDLTVAFRVIKAMEKDIEPTGENNILKDQFGREIYIYEGILARGLLREFRIDDRNLQEIHQQLTASYREFWDLINPTPAIASSSFPLDMENVDNPLVLERMATFEVKSKPSKKPPIQVEQPRQTGFKNPFKYSIFIGLILLLIMSLLWQQVLRGEDIPIGCATTDVESIKVVSGKKIVPQLKEIQEKYANQSSIYLTGSLTVESNQESTKKYINFTHETEKKPTNKFVPEDNKFKFELNDHPIELAIIDFENLKVKQDIEIDVKIIDSEKCKYNWLTNIIN